MHMYSAHCTHSRLAIDYWVRRALAMMLITVAIPAAAVNRGSRKTSKTKIVIGTLKAFADRYHRIAFGVFCIGRMPRIKEWQKTF